MGDRERPGQGHPRPPARAQAGLQHGFDHRPHPGKERLRRPRGLWQDPPVLPAHHPERVPPRLSEVVREPIFRKFVPGDGLLLRQRPQDHHPGARGDEILPGRRDRTPQKGGTKWTRN